MFKFTSSSKHQLALDAAYQVGKRAGAIWNDISTAPKDGTEILLVASLGSLSDMGVCYWREDAQFVGWTWGMGKSFNNPSHWMQLPPPP